MRSKTVLALMLMLVATLVVGQSTPSYSWNCPTEPVYGDSPAVSADRLGGWVKVHLVVCPQREYYVYYANDGTYRWVWVQLMQVSSVPNTASGWRHTTGGIVKDRAVPTQTARHLCVSWYYIDPRFRYVSYTLSTDCVYGPAVPGSTVPNSGEYNVGTVIRTVSFSVSDRSGSASFTLSAQWTIPRIQVSLDLTDSRAVKWDQYIYDGGDSSLGNTWGSMSWHWMYGLTVIAKPNGNFYLGVLGQASFWRCELGCLAVSYDRPLAAWFVKP